MAISHGTPVPMEMHSAMVRFSKGVPAPPATFARRALPGSEGTVTDVVADVRSGSVEKGFVPLSEGASKKFLHPLHGCENDSLTEADDAGTCVGRWVRAINGCVVITSRQARLHDRLD